METLVQRACGLDVHQASITACIKRQGIERQIRTFGTTTSELFSLRQWLMENQITHIAMESTGIYWKPVFNILSEEGWELLLVNARHIKNVPGRKTDIQDSEWICKLLRAGLLQGSFIPQQDIRQLRDLTRYRKKLQHQIQNEKNRVHKILQEANIKITGVLTDIFGVTGMKILNALATGVTDPVKLSNYLEHGRVIHKREQAMEALTGRFSCHHSFMLRKMLQYIAFLEQQIQAIDQQTDKHLTKYREQIDRLTTIPGVQQKAAASIIAEAGPTLESFPDEKHLASWSGLCPGHNESAGIKKSSRLKQGNGYLKAMLIECAWCAIRKKNHYLRSKYYSLVPRMGKKKALGAIAHKMLVAVYHILKNKIEYKELGANYLNAGKEEKLLKHYLKKLGQLGYTAELQPA